MVKDVNIAILLTFFSVPEEKFIIIPFLKYISSDLIGKIKLTTLERAVTMIRNGTVEPRTHSQRTFVKI